MNPPAARFARIAVRIPVRQLYTYSIPKAYVGEVGPGSMVEVPVLRRKETGVLVEWLEKPDLPPKKIKSICRPLTPEYVFPPDLIRLARWMSEYYLASLGETLSSLSFFGLRDLKPSTQRRLALADPDTVRRGLLEADSQARLCIPPLTPRQHAVALFFLENKNVPITRAELTRQEGCSSSVIDNLLEKGVLHEEVFHQERRDDHKQHTRLDASLTLNDEQAAALAPVVSALENGRFAGFLLHGITGSGKTEVYLQAIARVLEKGREAIVLVPEISLTPQAVDRFRRRFGDMVGVYHSHLTPGQKFDLWRRVKSGAVRVLIGARSALFTPFPNLGLIVVDEEHEHSYKQSDPAPRYHARDVALWRGRDRSVPVVLGSATPSLESIRNARTNKLTLLELKKRVGQAVLPDIHLVDMGGEVRERRTDSLLSDTLRHKVAERLDRGEQVILFLNRRGFSNFIFCGSCKTAVRCSHCDVVMTWHKHIGQLMCHFCGDTRARPRTCPECNEPDPAPMGAGTQRIEEEVAAAFPTARVLRVDLDSVKGKHGFLDMWERIESGHYDIILGTQMIAKGLHLEKVTLVGVISADHSLFLPDFRASERAFSQLVQVAGRAGRMSQKGEVILQTFLPHHYAIQKAVRQDLQGFFDQELHMREMLKFPPFFRLLLIRFKGKKQDQVEKRAVRLAGLLKEAAIRDNRYRHISLYGPLPSPIGKIKDQWRWQILIRGHQPSRMRELLEKALEICHQDKGHSAVSVILDMDPMDLL